MPLLHSRPFHSFPPSFRRFGVPHFVWFLVQSVPDNFTAPHHCCMAGRLPAGDSQSLPQYTISFGLNIFANVHFSPFLFARWDTFLQTTTDFLLDPRYPRVLSFLFRLHSAARLQILCRFLGYRTGITVVSSLGIS
jgi:hypothetical protein